ncbi:MAG: heavy-metal-associated domain-containing protein [Planctomycetes bacterium]|nr:heavy-metal-associated domain-containing protein [Planctomycetota bacterium]
MNISRFICMLIAGITIIGFTTIGYTTEEIKTEAATEVVLDVKGMTCGGCENKVKTALMNCEGVTDCEVNWKESKAMVMVSTGSVNTAEMIKVIEETGFSAESTEAIQYGAEPKIE